MDIEKETSIEFKVITIMLMIVSVIAILILIAFSTNLLEFKAESNAIEILSSSATTKSLTLQLKNIHSNDLLINEILIDGSPCRVCSESAVIKDRDELTVSCANVEHLAQSYEHSVAIQFTDKKKSYSKISKDLVSGSIRTTSIGKTSLTPIYEKIIFTNQKDELIYDVASNSCPQLTLTGSSEDTNGNFNLMVYSLDGNAQIQQSKEWDLNAYDTGVSVAQTALGKKIIFGHTYHPTQGGDTVLLQTNDLTPTFIEKIMGSSGSDIAKKIFLDADNFEYLITEITANTKKIQIVKQDTNKNQLWIQEITLSPLSTFLAANIHKGNTYVLISTPEGDNSDMYIFNSDGIQQTTLKIPSVIRSLTFDAEGNSILVGKKKGRADSDASITKYNSNGKLIWTQNWGESDQEQYNDAIVSADGTIFVVGSFEISLNNHRSFLHKYAKNGALIDSYLFRAPQSLKVTHVELTQEGLYAIGESYDGTQHDVYIAKFE